MLGEDQEGTGERRAHRTLHGPCGYRLRLEEIPIELVSELLTPPGLTLL